MNLISAFLRLCLPLLWLLVFIGCRTERTPDADAFNPEVVFRKIAVDLGTDSTRLDPLGVIHQDITRDGISDVVCVLRDMTPEIPVSYVYAFVGDASGGFALAGKNSELVPPVDKTSLPAVIYMNADTNAFTLFVEYEEVYGEYFVFEYRSPYFVLVKATRGMLHQQTGNLVEFSLYEHELNKAMLHQMDARVIRNQLIEKSQFFRPDSRLLSFPLDTVKIPLAVSSSLEILRPAGYERQDLKPGLTSKRWMGLFQVADGYELRPALISTDTLPFLNEREERFVSDSLVYIRTSSRDSCVLLISGTGWKAGKVFHADVERPVLWPGQTWSLTHKGTTYQWVCEGVMLNTQYDDQGNTYAHFIANYKLSMTRKVGNNVREVQVVAATPRFSQTMYAIRWVGDLDGDGWLDLLLDLGETFERERMVLYLSSHREEGQIVYPSAETTPVRVVPRASLL